MPSKRHLPYAIHGFAPSAARPAFPAHPWAGLRSCLRIYSESRMVACGFGTDPPSRSGGGRNGCSRWAGCGRAAPVHPCPWAVPMVSPQATTSTARSVRQRLRVRERLRRPLWLGRRLRRRRQAQGRQGGQERSPGRGRGCGLASRPAATRRCWRRRGHGKGHSGPLTRPSLRQGLRPRHPRRPASGGWQAVCIGSGWGLPRRAKRRTL